MTYLTYLNSSYQKTIIYIIISLVSKKYEQIIADNKIDADIKIPRKVLSVKNGFNKSEGITITYVDPTDIVYSFTESPYFDDLQIGL